jgi:hypothetical protein
VTRRHFIVLGGVLMMASCKQKAATAAFPSLQSRRSGPWRDGATHIQAGPYDIYYYGTAVPPAAPGGGAWSGTVTGDIFLIVPNGYMMVPNGSLTIGSDGSIRTSGQSRSGMIDTPGKP